MNFSEKHMNILIRTDSSLTMGTGHLIRCLTLADALKDKGADIHFICRELHGNLSHFVQERGYHLHLLPAPKNKFKLQEDDTAHASWLESSWQNDLCETQEVAGSVTKKFDWLIVDSYSLDYRWEKNMRSAADRIMVIDDLADRRHDCDLLLDQNYFLEPEKRYQDLVSDNCQKILGPQYALLRPEFRQAREFSQMRGNGVARILVYFGGNDQENLTGMVLEAMSCNELKHIYVDVIVGPYNSYMKNLQEQVNNRPNTKLHVQPNGFVELLLRADLCIGAGGTTTWERLCLYIPAIVITTALNQEALTSELDKAGFVCWIGNKDKISIHKLKTAVIKEILRLNSMKFLVEPNPVDGYGALRTAEIIIPSSKQTLSLRSVVISDMEFYFSWVNDPVSRKYAFSHEAISYETHKIWFKKNIYSSKIIMWILETPQGLPVGQIRFDVQNNIAEIDYGLDSLVRGRGWAKILLTQGINAFKAENKQTFICAKVKNENQPSCRAFQDIGFTEKKHCGGVTLFRLS